MDFDFKVSVCIPTYNHESYIRNCLDSVINQKCNFLFEVIIGDDASTDNNRILIEEYVSKYPNIIKPIFHEKNIGGDQNYLIIHQKAIGKYICHLDGDDYMLPGKLQAQVDFMDKNPDCNISFHRVKVLFVDGTLKEDLIDFERIKDGFERKDFLLYMAVATHSSKMYRSELKNVAIQNFKISDFFMNVEQVKNKKAYFIDNKCYGVYRSGIGQSTTSRENIKNIISQTLSFFLKRYPEDKKYINSLYLILFLVEFKKGGGSIFYLSGWIKSFCIQSFFILFETWGIRKMFRWPKI